MRGPAFLESFVRHAQSCEGLWQPLCLISWSWVNIAQRTGCLAHGREVVVVVDFQGVVDHAKTRF